MAAWAILSATVPSLSHSSSPSSSSQFPVPNTSTSFHVLPNRRINNFLNSPIFISNNEEGKRDLICRAEKAEKEYKFPDPIPEFADTETLKFKNHLIKKLTKKDELFGESIDEVAGICTQIFNEFLHGHYGGPGTLLVDPFIDMADIVNERGLPGGPEAARFAVKWAQAHVDKDWKEWTGTKN